MSYVDLVGLWEDPVNTTKHHAVKPIHSDYLRELTVLGARGVPMPNRKRVNWNKEIIGRELRISIVDENNMPVANTLVINALWDPQYEDEWRFVNKNETEENTFFLKDATFRDIPDDRKYQKGNSIVFELVMLILVNGKTFDMSCGWAIKKMSDLNKPKEDIILPMHGGNLNNELEINKKEVQDNKQSFFGKVGSLFTELKSELKLRYQFMDKLLDDQLDIKYNREKMERQKQTDTMNY